MEKSKIFLSVYEELKNFIFKHNTNFQQLKKIGYFYNTLQSKISNFLKKLIFGYYRNCLQQSKYIETGFLNHNEINLDFFYFKEIPFKLSVKSKKKKMENKRNLIDFVKKNTHLFFEKFFKFWINFLKKKTPCLFEFENSNEKIFKQHHQPIQYFSETCTKNIFRQSLSLNISWSNNNFMFLAQSNEIIGKLKSFHFSKKNTKFFKYLCLKIIYLFKKIKLIRRHFLANVIGFYKKKLSLPMIFYLDSKMKTSLNKYKKNFYQINTSYLLVDLKKFKKIFINYSSKKKKISFFFHNKHSPILLVFNKIRKKI